MFVIRKICHLKVIGLRNDEQMRAIQQRRCNTIKMLMCIMIMFYITLILYSLNIWDSFSGRVMDKTLGKQGLQLFFLLNYVLMGLNPLVICYYNDLFGKELRRLIGRNQKARKESRDVTSSIDSLVSICSSFAINAQPNATVTHFFRSKK